MISEDRDRVRGPLQVLLPLSEGEDNSEKFPIIDVVVSLNQREGLGKISAGVKVSCCIGLHQNGSSGQEGGIGHEVNGARDIGDTEDRGGGEDCFQGIKGVLLGFGPGPGEVLASEEDDGSNYIGVVWDKLSIEIRKPKERLNVFDR